MSSGDIFASFFIGTNKLNSGGFHPNLPAFIQPVFLCRISTFQHGKVQKCQFAFEGYIEPSAQGPSQVSAGSRSLNVYSIINFTHIPTYTQYLRLLHTVHCKYCSIETPQYSSPFPAHRHTHSHPIPFPHVSFNLQRDPAR